MPETIVCDRPFPLAVVAGVVKKDGKFLLCQRPAGKAHAGMWEFPGGKLEKGESPEEALCRELFEELGMRVRVLRIVDAIRRADASGDTLLLFYECTAEDEPVAREHSAICFFPPEEIGKRQMPPMDRAFWNRYTAG